MAMQVSDLNRFPRLREAVSGRPELDEYLDRLAEVPTADRELSREEHGTLVDAAGLHDIQTAALTMTAPGGHQLAARVYCNPVRGYWSAWSVPAVRDGKPCFKTEATEYFSTLESALAEIVIRVQASRAV